MIRSMTAYARKVHRDEQGELIWELRSVNHRYLDTSVRIPEELRVLEPLVRERVLQRLGRGKVDCNLRFEPGNDAKAEMKVNERLVGQIIEAVRKVGRMQDESVPPPAMDVLRWPGVLEVKEQDWTPVQCSASGLLDEALALLVESREREGERLGALIAQRSSSMAEQVAKVRQQMPGVLAGVRTRLRERLAEVADELDEGRLEQEMVMLAQRLDVDEEMDRISAHLEEVADVLEWDEPVGRRLDFLMQEMNREANTLASKSNNVEITRIAVEMKVLIEQMREQVQNIE